MEIPIEGKFMLVTSENFDGYLKSCGVNFIFRTIANTFKPLLEIYKDEEGYWVWHSETPIKTISIRCRFGEKFDVDFPDGSGRKMTVFPKRNGNTITFHQELEGSTLTDVKEFSEDGIVTTLTHGEIVCVRKYRRVE